MPLKKPEFGGDAIEILKEETLFQGFARLVRYRLRHRLFRGGWTLPLERELLVRREACAAILYDPEHDLVGLVEQFRVGALQSEYGPWCLEVVAGLVDPGETPDQVIKREIHEEAGITEVEVVLITSYYTTPGACNEKIYLYSGLCNLSEAGGIFGLDHENEDIRLHSIPAEEALAAMFSSRLNNASTLIGLQWLQANRVRLRKSGIR